MDQQNYRAIKGQLDFRPRSWVAVLQIAVDGGLLGAALGLLHQGSVWAFVLSQILLCILFFRSFALMHDAGHGSCARSKVFNLAVGCYASVLCFTPFLPWKHMHQRHHIWAGNPERDPTARNLLKWRKAGRLPLVLRMAWRSWIPLGAFMQHGVFWAYPLKMWSEDRRAFAPVLASVALLPTIYMAAHWAWPSLFAPANFVGAFLLYLFVEELVNLPHHADLFWFERRLPLWEQHRAARSCDYPFPLAELLVLNFNFHIEHHLFPSLPWYRLRRARDLLRPALGPQYNGAVGVHWNLDNRRRELASLLLERPE